MINHKVELSVPIIVPSGHPCLIGHFPSKPVAPGALVLELMVAGFLARYTNQKLVEITHAKFLQPVLPATVYSARIEQGSSGLLNFTLSGNQDKPVLKASMRFQNL